MRPEPDAELENEVYENESFRGQDLSGLRTSGCTFRACDFTLARINGSEQQMSINDVVLLDFAGDGRNISGDELRRANDASGNGLVVLRNGDTINTRLLDITGIPSRVLSNSFSAKGKGSRTQPFDAAWPGSGPPCNAMPFQVMRCICGISASSYRFER